MPDRIKKILDKVLAWWNKFTTKQKTIIVGASAAVIFRSEEHTSELSHRN